MEDYDYSFSQNGLVAYKAGELIGQQVGPSLPRFLLVPKTLAAYSGRDKNKREKNPDPCRRGVYKARAGGAGAYCEATDVF